MVALIAVPVVGALALLAARVVSRWAFPGIF